MALIFTERLRQDIGGKSFRCYDVTCDGSTVSIDAKDIDLNTIETAMVEGAADLIGTVSISGAQLADAAGSTLTVTLTGAVLGDAVNVASGGDNIDLTITAYVQAANAVEIRIQNESGDNRTPEDGYECRIRKTVGLKTYRGEAIVFGPPLRSGDIIRVWAYGG